MHDDTTFPGFFYRAVTWLRTQPNFATRVPPEQTLDPQRTGLARLDGWLSRASRAEMWNLLGINALALGLVLSMFNLPAVRPQTTDAVNVAGYAVTVAAAGCLAAGELARRRNRTRSVVEIRAARSPATPASVAEFEQWAGGAEPWLVSERPLEEETLAVAARLGVRCYVEGPHGFGEVAAPKLVALETSSDSAHQSPGASASLRPMDEASGSASWSDRVA